MQDPHERLSLDYDEVVDTLDAFIQAAQFAKVAFEQGDFREAIMVLAGEDNAVGDSWRELVNRVERYRDNAAELYETGTIREEA